MDQLILVDGSSYLFRAFHAMPYLNNSEGEPTGAVYGVVNMLKKLEADYAPTHIAVVFDAKGGTFRNEMYAEYKANRPPMPDELRSQIDHVHASVKAMGMPLLCIPGVEADDVIGTLANSARDGGAKVIIVSGDKDLTQLVDDSIVMVDTMNDVRYDHAGVVKKFGVPPERIIDFLALVGDTSDNIPGIPKVGPKTAVKWLEQYGSLDGIIEHAGDIKGKVGENLRDNLGQLALSRALVTIKCDVDVDASPESLVLGEQDDDALRDLFARLEFKSWLTQLGGALPDEESDEDDAIYQTILDTDALKEWIETLHDAGEFSIDTETTSIDAMRAKLVGISFSATPGHAAYLPVAHDYDDAPAQLSLDTVKKLLGPLLADPDIEKIGQNLKYDLSVLANHGIVLDGIAFDSMLESYVLDSTGSRHDMDSLAIKYLGYNTVKFEEVAGSGKSQVTFDKINIDEATRYAAEDADITLRLHQHLMPRLVAEKRLNELYRNIEMPLVPVLSRVERNGVRVDVDMLRQHSAELAERIDEVERRAHDVAGESFSIASPKQIQHQLFDKLGLPVISKTPKGQPSTAESVLQELAVDYELPALILEHRGLAKLRSTYTDKLPDLVNPDTGRIHTSYHQAVAATGRLSSSDPNLQNIPVRTREGRRIREAFIADDGHLLVSIDYSQIELRIMAHLSGDEGLLKAFAEGRDIHRATAAEVFGATLDSVTDDQRRAAKAINFGLIYGMSAFGLGRQLGIDRTSAQEYVDLYFERYPGVKNFMDRTRELAREQHYVETVFGRRLNLPEINSRNFQRRQYAERTAINAPMQGTAADLIKMAMINVDRWIRENSSSARIIMQVHDELVLEVLEDDAEAIVKTVGPLMTGVASLKVPLEVDAGIGRNWAEAH
ncbi:MAG: DNA polymerase I [marine bacterium B5-7]|nr:MAG: DNA polymerase I [marine bacterium B5-7]